MRRTIRRNNGKCSKQLLGIVSHYNHIYRLPHDISPFCKWSTVTFVSIQPWSFHLIPWSIINILFHTKSIPVHFLRKTVTISPQKGCYIIFIICHNSCRVSLGRIVNKRSRHRRNRHRSTRCISDPAPGSKSTKHCSDLYKCNDLFSQGYNS